MVSSTNNRQQFLISEATISANRFASDDIDVTALIYELTIFESLQSAYLTGKVAIVDDKSLFSSINFSGTEFLNIKLQPIIGDETIVTKRFVMSKMVNAERSSNNADVIVFQLIEDHGYFNSLRTLSRAYTQSIEKIVSQIVNGELRKKVDLSYLTNETTAQGVRKFIIPYLTPLDACKMLVDRATSVNGSPVFLYSTIHDNNVRLGDLDKMLKQNAFNAKSPFVFSQAKTVSSDTVDELSKATTIDQYVRMDQEDTLFQIMQGAVGAEYTNTDLGTGQSFNSHVDIETIINNLRNAGVLDRNNTQVVYDTALEYLGKPATDYNSQFFHQVNSSLTYNQIKSYHDAASGNDFLLKMKRHIIEQALFKNLIKFTVPGQAFMMARASVGDICSFKVTRNLANDKNTSEDIFDEKGSGNFLVYALRHQFRDTRHTVFMEVCRLDRTKVI